MSSLETIYYLLFGSALLSLLISLRRLPAHFRWLLPLLAVGLLSQFIQNWASNQAGKQLYIFFHIYHPIEFALYALFFYHSFENPFYKKLVVMASAGFGLALGIFYSIYPGHFLKLGFIDFSLAGLFLAFLCVLFLADTFARQGEGSVLFNPGLWFGMGTLLYYSGSFLLMGLIDYLRHINPEFAENLLTIHMALNLLLYLLYCVSFLIVWVKKHKF